MSTTVVSAVIATSSRHEVGIGALDQGAGLQPGEQEDESLDDVDDQVPEEDALQPRRRADEERALPAHIEPGGDGREHAGAAEILRHPIGGIGRDQGQHDLDPRIGRPAAQPEAQPADADAVGDFADDDDDEGPGGLERRERAGDDGGDGEAIEDQRGRVVGEAFAFENDEQAPRNVERPRQRQRRDHVGRRDDGAEQEAHRPWPAEQPMDRGRHRAGREHHAAEGQQRDRPQVEAELAPAHRHAGRVDDRRQEDQEHEFRRELDRRQAGNERQNDAGDDEEDRRRGAEAPRQHRDRREHGKQNDDDLDRRSHRSGARSLALGALHFNRAL